MYIPDGIEQALCGRCLDRIIDHERASEGGLEELRPRWQPDKRARRASQLYLAKLPAFVVANIAAFEVGQWVP